MENIWLIFKNGTAATWSQKSFSVQNLQGTAAMFSIADRSVRLTVNSYCSNRLICCCNTACHRGIHIFPENSSRCGGDPCCHTGPSGSHRSWRNTRSDSWSFPSEYKRYNKKNQKQEKQYFCNSGSSAGDTSKTQNSCNDSND